MSPRLAVVYFKVPLVRSGPRHQKERHVTMQISGKKVLIQGKLIRIARLDAEGYDFLEDPEGALISLRKCQTRVDLFTFTQKLSEDSPKYKYPMEWDNVAALPVSTFDHWMARQIDFKARNKARKAAKSGITVREIPFDEDLIRGISAIYNESPIRQGKPFWHYGKDLETLRRMKVTFLDRSVFIGAFLEGSLIGFAKLVSNEDKSQAGLMHIVSMFKHRDKAPTNALLAQAVRSCAERGIPHLWYANFSYGKKQVDSLAEFKRHNGFQKIELPRYYIPLTVVGCIALRLQLHHKATDWIPEPLAARYRKIRSSWYARRFPGFDNA
jgi:hypothetical protein